MDAAREHTEPRATRLERVGAYLRTHRGDILGVSFLLIVVFLYLSPAIKDGPSFGPTDIGSGLSALTNRLVTAPVHDNVNGDQITQFIPWNILNYNLVHSGQFPLWDSLSGNGLPQFLNFDSAPLSLSSLFGYLVPLSLSFLIGVATKLLIAGLGTYLACRVLKCRPLAASLGGAAFMLSGAFSGWLGWSQSSVFCWSGFLLAGVMLCYRDRARARHVILLALSVAFCIYGGFPEGYALLGAAFLVILFLAFICALVQRRTLDLTAIFGLVLATVIGLMLSAPLLWPGISVVREATRAGKDAATGLPSSVALLLFAQGYDGLPLHGSAFFGNSNYFESAAYLGVVVVVLAFVGLATGLRRPIVLGLGAGGLFSLLLVYRLGSHIPVENLVKDLGLGSIAIQRELSFVGFVAAMLAGVGLESLLSSLSRGAAHARTARLSALFATLAVGLVLGFMWSHVDTAGREVACTGPVLAGDGGLSSATCDSLRRSSLFWPSATFVVLLVVFVLLLIPSVRAHLSDLRQLSIFGSALVAMEVLFLVFAGIGINSYGKTPFPASASVTKLSNIVGTDLVGLNDANVAAIRQWTGFGLYPNTNIGYGIDEFALHDPIVPEAVYTGWPIATSDRVTPGNLNVFYPAVTTLALARDYGISYVLTRPGIAQPGMSPVASIANGYDESLVWSSDRTSFGRFLEENGQELYLVPDSGRFMFSSHGAKVLSSRSTSNSTYAVSVRVARPSVLHIAITDSPGWHVSANGKPLSIARSSEDLMQVTLPRGTTSVTLDYLPRSLLEGSLLALIAVLFLVGIAIREHRKTRRRAAR